METINVLCTARFTDEQLRKLKDVSDRLAVGQITCKTADDVTAALEGENVHVLYTYAGPKTLEHAPDLKWVQLHSAGADHLIDTPIWGTDIPITTASGIHTITIGEYVIASMLAFTRHVPRMVEYRMKSEWPEGRWEKFLGRTLRGSTICIVGYGSIGREVARLAKGFGMRVLAIKNNPGERQDRGFTLPGTGDPEGAIPEAVYPPEELRDVLAGSDFVVVSLPSTKASKKMIGDKEFDAMPEHAYLVNVSRGDVIDEGALAVGAEGRPHRGSGAGRVRKGASACGQPALGTRKCDPISARIGIYTRVRRLFNRRIRREPEAVFGRRGPVEPCGSQIGLLIQGGLRNGSFLLTIIRSPCYN